MIIELSSRYAAAIQILYTCRAMAEHGAVVDVFVRHSSGSAAECLGYFGPGKHPALHVRELLSSASCWSPEPLDPLPCPQPSNGDRTGPDPDLRPTDRSRDP